MDAFTPGVVSLGAYAGKLLQLEERMQSLVAENFMRVVGTHNRVSRYKKNAFFVYLLAIFELNTV